MNTKSLIPRIVIKLWQLEVVKSCKDAKQKLLVFLQERPLGKENIIFKGLVTLLRIPN